MGRLWHSRILADWNPIFIHLPIENMILKNQAAYYKVIEQSTEENDSGIFIDFMLKIIAKIIKSNRINDTVNLIIQHLKENPEISYEQFAAKIGKSRVTVSRKISELKKV
ncbi:hypothetical protein [Treponema sp.]|uniref:hypothetical protein n=1 Tax=Treponema sp. TaxID=166 RepID=UPI003FA2008D